MRGRSASSGRVAGPPRHGSSARPSSHSSWRTFSTGRGGIHVDLIEAHKWFNLAALSGCTRGQECRAEIALEMTAREIAEAQRQARAWLSTTGYHRRAA